MDVEEKLVVFSTDGTEGHHYKQSERRDLMVWLKVGIPLAGAYYNITVLAATSSDCVMIEASRSFSADYDMG